jgi:hypothetical protein
LSESKSAEPKRNRDASKEWSVEGNRPAKEEKCRSVDEGFANGMSSSSKSMGECDSWCWRSLAERLLDSDTGTFVFDIMDELAEVLLHARTVRLEFVERSLNSHRG